MKVFPSLFGLAVVNSEKITQVRELLEKLSDHPHLHSCQLVIRKWKFSRHIREEETLLTATNNSFHSHGTCLSEFGNTIGYDDITFFINLCRWLKYHKLHKYTYFFGNLCYQEFISINDLTIDELAIKVSLIPITTGGRNTIVRKMEGLQSRIPTLEKYLVSDYFVEQKRVLPCLNELKKMLHTPIFGRDRQIPDLLLQTFEKLSKISGGFPIEENDQFLRILKAALGCYFFSFKQKTTIREIQSSVIASKNDFSMCSVSSLKTSTSSRTTSESDIAPAFNTTYLGFEEILLERNIELMRIQLLKIVDY